ncbi:MAG: succinate dehydrogenase, cytochrome b556 subunit [Chromatiaceae bacterium]|jgi:succinate dehydrogenase / fumarate reductase cytochrome b subunit
MQSNRPVFLDLWRIKLPATGIVSILHRISGVLMVLAIPAAAILLHLALSGPEGFQAAAGFLGNGLVRLALLVLAWSLLHHLFAGLRYLLLDLGIGLDRAVARQSAWTTILSALAVLVIGLGVIL